MEEGKSLLWEKDLKSLGLKLLREKHVTSAEPEFEGGIKNV